MRGALPPRPLRRRGRVLSDRARLDLMAAAAVLLLLAAYALSAATGG